MSIHFTQSIQKIQDVKTHLDEINGLIMKNNGSLSTKQLKPPTSGHKLMKKKVNTS